MVAIGIPILDLCHLPFGFRAKRITYPLLLETSSVSQDKGRNGHASLRGSYLPRPMQPWPLAPWLMYVSPMKKALSMEVRG